MLTIAGGIGGGEDPNTETNYKATAGKSRAIRKRFARTERSYSTIDVNYAGIFGVGRALKRSRGIGKSFVTTGESCEKTRGNCSEIAQSSNATGDDINQQIVCDVRSPAILSDGRVLSFWGVGGAL
jgi:hypothetical protein